MIAQKFGSFKGGALPIPGIDALGGVKRNAGAAGQFVTGIDSGGALTFDTPAGGGGGGGIVATLAASSSTALTAEQCNNGVVYVTGGGYLYLPPLAEGMSVTIIVVNTSILTIIPDSSDQILVDGVGYGTGNGPANTGSTGGDKAILTYHSPNNWYAATNGWSSGV